MSQGKKKFDIVAIQRYLSSQAVKDFDSFLDSLPEKAGKISLICAAIVWICAAAAILFVSTQTSALNKMKLEQISVEALVPKVPQVVKRPVDREDLDEFLESIKGEYSKVSAKANRSGQVTVSSPTTSGYFEFRRLLDHLQYGGNNWRIDIETMCIGRECKGAQINANLLISQVRVVE